VNKENYANLTPSKSELKMVKTSDGKEMGVWFHYPPNFDPNKKYPTLLYCQGGPQSALTQFFSTRWNFALMAEWLYRSSTKQKRNARLGNKMERRYF
jgi:dipeptidyl aminopeptidase/acylaminoacyl peptidase